ncbi:hypothetical protein [Burkholderia pseudomultivorans]|uniref:hypothetical protein n=1 Tax=Burkholderia pseudomultivorans TaxID=1207504 RepID=UPI000A96D51E|nr:hypothetical protein [Burkholderia pseudomultivorans]
MKKRNLLDELIEGRLSQEAAEKVYDLYMDNLTEADPPVTEMLGFSKKEWTAHAHGAPFEVIAEWRERGWPDRCFLCGERIVSDDFGWLPREHEGKYGLRHIVCAKDKPIDCR